MYNVQCLSIKSFSIRTYEMILLTQEQLNKFRKKSADKIIKSSILESYYVIYILCILGDSLISMEQNMLKLLFVVGSRKV